ncbi:hypothetical protein [Paraburkholderia adhaesiva]|uniref:hypothetical protein n=1 Tax=Paraburkholderia adhaesiva TaxID=2883244 RepID=UPI001F247249|nr:hypothetical protein [Paraburkholderia adhaesiva]
MNKPERASGRRAAGLFTNPAAWVLMAGDADGAAIAASNRTASGGSAIRCFLSPIDAIIGAAGLAHRDEHYAVLAAADLPPAAFLERGSADYHASLHVAWSARDGQVLLHVDGAPAEQFTLLHQPFQETGGFEVSADALAALDRLYDRAGLFAWRETLVEVSRWDRPRLEGICNQIAGTLRESGCREPGVRGNQLALFDPESCCWHFVPRSVLD